MIERYVYCDGSAPSNGKEDCVAGWACIETDSSNVTTGKVLQASSGAIKPGPDQPKPTSIRAELTAATEALKLTRPGDVVTLFSDSAYVINGLRQAWYKAWRRTGKNSLGKVPANLDLWNQLVEEFEARDATPKHIKGHNGHRFQELCDSMAVSKARGL